MGDEQASAEQLVALRAALLELHEAVLDPKPSRRTQRLVRRMQRAHLSWLLVPWYLVKILGVILFARRRGSMAVEAQASRLYGQLNGKDSHVAQAEIHRMVQQLGWLDERHRWLDDEERPDASGGADQTELEAAVAVELARLRRMAGVGGRELAAQLGISQSKLSRIETGAAVPTLPDVLAWADAVNAPQETRDHLVQLTEAAYTEVESWRAAFRGGRTQIQDDTGMYETTAHTIKNFHPAIVPGLLQTSEYTRRVLSASEIDAAGIQHQDQAAAVAGRLRRQEALYDKTRRFEFLITEAALRWQSRDTGLILPQLDRIASLATLDNVWVGFLPTDAAMPGWPEHNFQLYEDRDDDQEPVVRIELLHARVVVSNPQDVAVYQEQFASWRAIALHGDDAQDFLRHLGHDIQGLHRRV